MDLDIKTTPPSSEPKPTPSPGQSMDMVRPPLPLVRPANNEHSTAQPEQPKLESPNLTKPKRRRSKLKLTLLISAAVAVLALGLGGWDAWQLYHKVNHLAVGNLTPSVNGAENILVAGSTNRCNLTVQNAQWGFCTADDSGVNSDVIFIVHLNLSTKTVSLLSIPRDTFVPDARSGNVAFKIDAALYQGPTQLVKAVEEDFGIPIQHYVEVGFDGFVNVVNAVGGVKMYFPMPVYDSYSYLDVTTPGCKLLNGVEALQVVRARHLQYKGAGVTTNDPAYWPQETLSDIARITRTHEFLRVLAQTVAVKGVGNPVTDQKLIDAIAPQLQVDNGLNVSAMLQLINDFHSININSVPQYTLPVSVTGFGSYVYNGYDEGDVVFPSAPQDYQTIDQFLGASASTNPLTGKPLSAPSSIKVSVINGSGTANQATTIAAGLTQLGFTVVGQPGTNQPVSDQAQETVVNYSSAASEGEALAVAAKLTGYVILSQNASAVISGSDVTVITGTNAGVSGTTTQTSTSQSSAAAASSSIAPPNSAVQGLAPWDPQACPKS